MRPLSLKPQLNLKAFGGKVLCCRIRQDKLSIMITSAVHIPLQHLISSGFDFAHWLVEISEVTFKATGAQFRLSKNV